jgi:hypothetical protein
VRCPAPLFPEDAECSEKSADQVRTLRIFSASSEHSAISVKLPWFREAQACLGRLETMFSFTDTYCD